MAPTRTSATPKRASVASFLAEASSALLSAELDKLVLDPADIAAKLATIEAATGSSAITQSFAKLFHRSSRGLDTKIKVFGSKESSMLNEVESTYKVDDTLKLVATKLTPIKSVPQTADRVSLIRQYSFSLAAASEWSLTVEIVKELTNPLEFSARLGSAKAALVDSDLGSIDPSAYDFVLTKLSYLGEKKLSLPEIIEVVEDVKAFGGTVEDASEYQDSIHALAKDIFRDPVIISQFKRKSGFKRLCANTIELSRPIYFKQVLPTIDTFYLTDKMDGARAMLIIDEVYRRSGHRRIYLGADIKVVADKLYPISSFKKPAGGKTIETDHTVLDVEMMSDNTFHCFDVISFASKRMSNSPFKARYAKFPDVDALMAKHELGSTKEFIKLTKDGYSKQIKEFFEKKRSYHIDGLIFTPEGVHFKNVPRTKNRFAKVFNTDYSSTISFKWKPLDQLTIDFYLMAHPSKKNSYVLCSGIDARTFAQLRLRFFEGYVSPKSPNSHQYFPIQFDPLDVWTPTEKELSLCSSKCTTLDGMVGEFAFADSKGRLDRPKMIRLREDRKHDIALGQYYGNALRYSELIWHSIQHPLTIETMRSPMDIGYFATNDVDDWYKAQRNFNSYVKTHLMETYLYPKSVKQPRIMDIAAGKGQDLARSIDVGYEEIVALDKDMDALYEILDRKYNLRVKRNKATANIHVKQIDLEDSADATIKSLKLPEASTDSAMINFALHYICHGAAPGKDEPLIEFAKLVAFYLKKGGRLMITTFNGEDIFKLFDADKNEWALEENDRVKYSIKRAFSSDTLTSVDQGIDVLLPFSNGEYYREYLVNYQHVQEVFEEHGLRLISSDSFGSLIRAYKKQNARGYAAMTDADREYVGLYGFMIFERE